MKKCSKCKHKKEESCFRKRGGENYLRTECKDCTKRIDSTKKRLKKKYGRPPSFYQCPICKRTTNEAKGEGGKRVSSFVLDHCHISNKFRGWLCHKCNRGLGAFGDDIETLRCAIDYLSKG